MIVCLVFVASSSKYNQRVGAVLCCEGCTGNGDPDQLTPMCMIYYFDCLNDPNNPSTYCAAAFYDCVHDGSDCYRDCRYCWGEGPGNECSSNSDCSVEEFCDASNHCSHW